MTHRIRVLQVLSGLGVGGAETWLMELLRRWNLEGNLQIDFLLTGGSPQIFDEEVAKLGAGLYYFKYSRSNLASFANSFRNLLFRHQYDAIHDHSDYAAGWRFALAAGLLPRVRIAHVHNPWLHIEANYAVSPCRKLAATVGKALTKSLATHVCGTSDEILRQYGFEPRGSKGPNVDVVHCGFDVGRFSAPREKDRAHVLAEFGWPSNSKLILYAGRLDRALEFAHPQNHKNSWMALHIAREAATLDPTIRLIMAGTGPSREALREQVRNWGLSERLKLPGIRNDVPLLMRAANVLLFPSAQEGLGMVAVEAQATGLPVLASAAVPREAIVVPSLYETLPLNAPIQTWVEQLLSIIDRPRACPATCRKAIEASDFSIVNSARKLESIYRWSA